MDKINTDLQRKINALGLLSVGTTIHNEYLKERDVVGSDVSHFEYYKMYGKQPMFYSREYLISSTIEELLKKDKKNYQQFCPSFFVPLKRKFGVEIKIVGEETYPPS
ncbi:hypothetical protein AB1283_04160 [Bacillus sp. S13(2024)]|uniref:hypothetical protein n=1 Tax=unclassified Bacillus (in: firmicutes) TaxID=185979 RepID=UPI003D1C2AD9